jgi:hypothetical protein
MIQMKNPVVAIWSAARIVAQAATRGTRPRPRCSIRPSRGADSAWVSGTLMRAGPMIAIVCSIAARLAP